MQPGCKKSDRLCKETDLFDSNIQIHRKMVGSYGYVAGLELSGDSRAQDLDLGFIVQAHDKVDTFIGFM